MRVVMPTTRTVLDGHESQGGGQPTGAGGKELLMNNLVVLMLLKGIY